MKITVLLECGPAPVCATNCGASIDQLRFVGCRITPSERASTETLLLVRSTSFLRTHAGPSFSVRCIKNIITGLTIGIVLIPQGLAYASLAGLPPVYGLYTGFPAIIC